MIRLVFVAFVCLGGFAATALWSLRGQDAAGPQPRPPAAAESPADDGGAAGSEGGLPAAAAAARPDPEPGATAEPAKGTTPAAEPGRAHADFERGVADSGSGGHARPDPEPQAAATAAAAEAAGASPTAAAEPKRASAAAGEAAPAVAQGAPGPAPEPTLPEVQDLAPRAAFALDRGEEPAPPFAAEPSAAAEARDRIATASGGDAEVADDSGGAIPDAAGPETPGDPAEIAEAPADPDASADLIRRMLALYPRRGR